MNKYKKPYVDEDKLGLNPFLISLVVPVAKIKTNDRYIQDGNEWYKSEIEFDGDTYCKVFIDSARRIRMGKLTPRGKDLLLWLVYEVERGKYWLWLNKIRYMEECGVSSMNTYRAAVNDLIGGGYINKTVMTDVFWINPALFFNGSRVAAFPNNVKVK